MGETLELGIGDLLRQLFDQNQRHDLVLGTGENQGGLTNEMGPIPAVKIHGRGRLSGEGIKGLRNRGTHHLFMKSTSCPPA